MIFNHKVSEIIRMRTSYRSYTKKVIAEEMHQMIAAYLSNLGEGPFRSQTHFEIVGAKENNQEMLKGLGTYGTIRNPRGFIIGKVKKSDKDMEDFGYLMEKIVLFLTDLGFGTCWLGGSFRRSNFASRISTGSDELVPAVVSVGHMANKRSSLDSIIRLSAGSKKRKDWEELFFKDDMNTVLTKEEAGKYCEPFEMIRLGPSASNRQPWRILLIKNRIHFFLFRSKQYRRNLKILKLNDLQRVDIGIAMCHFELSAREQGMHGLWQIRQSSNIQIPEDMVYIASWIEQS